MNKPLHLKKSEVDTAIILAGGLGTRLWPVVRKVPKPMAPVQGRPFLLHLLEYWHRQGIRRFILSVGYKSNSIQDKLKKCWRKSSLEFVKENKPHGTGGALLLCLKRKNLKTPFLLLNGDTFFPVSLNKLEKHASEKKADWCLSLFSSKDNERYLTVKLKKNHLISSLKDKMPIKKRQPKGLSNGGVYWVDPRVMRLFRPKKTPISLEKEILPTIIRKGFRIVGFPSRDRFIDIGIPEDFKKAQTFPFKIQKS